MKLHQLRNVVAVVEHGSLRAAARHLGLAQPAMSRSIHELEGELGATLFERSKSGMTLTATGELFARRARALTADFQRTREEMCEIINASRETFSVAFCETALLAVLPRAYGLFSKKFPDVCLKLVEASLPMLATEVRDGVIDLYAGHLPRGFSDPALTTQSLFESEQIIVCRRGHPLAKATSLEDLVGVAWVTTPMSGNEADDDITSMFRAAGLPSPDIAMQAGSGVGVTTAVGASDLLAALPSQWLDFIEATGSLVRIPLQHTLARRTSYLVRRSDLPPTPAQAFFVETLQGVAA